MEFSKVYYFWDQIHFAFICIKIRNYFDLNTNTIGQRI